jgi:hypothetical protein
VEITDQGDPRRIEVPTHMEEPDRAWGGLDTTGAPAPRGPS